MEKQLLKRLALSALVISSVAQAQEGKEQKQTWTEWSKAAIQRPFSMFGLGATGKTVSQEPKQTWTEWSNGTLNATKNVVTYPGAYIPAVTVVGYKYGQQGIDGLKAAYNAADAYVPMTAGFTSLGNGVKAVGNVVADYTIRTKPARFVGNGYSSIDAKNDVAEQTRNAHDAATSLKAANELVEYTKTKLDTLQATVPTAADKIEQHAKLVVNAETQYKTAIEAQKVAESVNAAAIAKLETAKAALPTTETPAPTVTTTETPAPTVTTTETPVQTVDLSSDVITAEEAAAQTTQTPAPKVEAPAQKTDVAPAVKPTLWTKTKGYASSAKDYVASSASSAKDSIASSASSAKDYVASYVPERISTPWNNSSTTTKVAAAAAVGLTAYGTYKLYNWYKSSKGTTVSDLLKNATREELAAAKVELTQITNALSVQDDKAFNALRAGLANKDAKMAEASEIFVDIELSKESRLTSLVAKLQATLKDTYSTVKAGIEQWNKDGRKGYSTTNTVQYGVLYNKVVVAELNAAFAAIKAAELATK